jgi:hypothetical protein
VSTPSVHYAAPLTWWSPMYGLIWSDDDERTYQLLEAGQAVERLTLPLDAVQLYEGTPCCCGDC